MMSKFITMVTIFLISLCIKAQGSKLDVSFDYNVNVESTSNCLFRATSLNFGDDLEVIGLYFNKSLIAKDGVKDDVFFDWGDSKKSCKIKLEFSYDSKFQYRVLRPHHQLSFKSRKKGYVYSQRTRRSRYVDDMGAKGLGSAQVKVTSDGLDVDTFYRPIEDESQNHYPLNYNKGTPYSKWSACGEERADFVLDIMTTATYLDTYKAGYTESGMNFYYFELEWRACE